MSPSLPSPSPNSRTFFHVGWRCFLSVRPPPHPTPPAIVEGKSSFCLSFQHCWAVSNLLICNDWVRRRTFQWV